MKIAREMIFVMILILVFYNKKIIESWKSFLFLLEERKNGVLAILCGRVFQTYILGSGTFLFFHSASSWLLIASLHSKYKLKGIKRNNWLGFKSLFTVIEFKFTEPLTTLPHKPTPV